MESQEREAGSVLRGRPSFAEGERVELKGVPFVVQRVNRTNIVLLPLPTDRVALRASELMRRYTRGPALPQ